VSLIPHNHECARCGGYDLPPGARHHGLSSECRCGASIYDGEERFSEPTPEPVEQDTNVND
jgi:hypothetical protein